MTKRNRTIDDYISILTYLWLKWIDNHEKSNNTSFDFKERRKAGERCEKLQAVRQRVIRLLNNEIERILLNGNL